MIKKIYHVKLIILALAVVSMAPQILLADPEAIHTESPQDLNILNYVMRLLKPNAYSANWELASRYSVPSGPWDSLVQANQSLGSKNKLENVNEWVNINVSLGNGKGDCEDSAIAKMQLLKKLGFADEQFFLVYLFDKLLQEYHALLLVKIPEGVYVLDNKLSLMGKELQKDTELKDYQPVSAFTRNRTFWFGTLYSAAP